MKPTQLPFEESDSTVDWSRWLSHEHAHIRARAVGVLIQAKGFKQEEIVSYWADPSLFVREQLAYNMWQTHNVVGLSMGWNHVLSDQESCRLALQLASLGQESEVLKRIGEGQGFWNPFSSGSLEDRWTCAIAAHSLMGVSTRVSRLIDTGDFPLSIPWMLDVLHFAKGDLITLLEDQADWFEEGLRAPMFTVLMMRNDRFKENVELAGVEWSLEECLDAVDMMWMEHKIPEQVHLLESVVLHKPACEQWLKYAKVSVLHLNIHALKEPLTSLYSSRDDLSGAFRALRGRNDLSMRQKKRVRAWIHPRLQLGVETTILTDVADSIEHWGDLETLSVLKDVRLSTLDPQAQMEIQIAIWRLHQQLVKLQPESDTL